MLLTQRPEKAWERNNGNAAHRRVAGESPEFTEVAAGDGEEAPGDQRELRNSMVTSVCSGMVPNRGCTDLLLRPDSDEVAPVAPAALEEN